MNRSTKRDAEAVFFGLSCGFAIMAALTGLTGFGWQYSGGFAGLAILCAIASNLSQQKRNN